MESNKTYHYFFKYCLLGISILLIIVAGVSWFVPETMMINGQQGMQDISITLIFGLISILAFLTFLIIKDKFALVELGNQSIKIKYKGQEENIQWIDVEEVKLFRFVSPPLYKLRLKHRDETIWFNTEPNYVSINGFVSDLSEMGDFIEKKKRELGI